MCCFHSWKTYFLNLEFKLWSIYFIIMKIHNLLFLASIFATVTMSAVSLWTVLINDIFLWLLLRSFFCLSCSAVCDIFRCMSYKFFVFCHFKKWSEYLSCFYSASLLLPIHLFSRSSARHIYDLILLSSVCSYSSTIYVTNIFSQVLFLSHTGFILIHFLFSEPSLPSALSNRLFNPPTEFLIEVECMHV